MNCISAFTLSDGRKHKKSLRSKFDSLSKEKSKDKGNVADGILLTVSIYNV